MARVGKAGAFFLFAALDALFVAALTPRLLEVQKLRQRSETLEKDLAALKRQNDSLEAEMRLLRDDPVYLEKVARSKFNKAKEGEIVYKVVREGENTR